MVVRRKGQVKCELMLCNQTLEQFSRYKYLESWIIEEARCEEEIKTRIALAEEAFWKNIELLRRNIRP